MSSDDRLSVAIKIATAAGDLAKNLRRQPGKLQAEAKGRLDFVTQADLATEALIRSLLADAFPKDGVLGEEDGLDRDTDRFWIVDPIDGTTNYLRGMPHWAVSIAYFDGKALTHGVIHAPDLGIIAAAELGKPALLNGGEVDLTAAEPAVAPIVTLGYSERTALPDYLTRISRLTEAGVEHRRQGAATLEFIGILAGWVDAYHEESLNIWDAAAGIVLIKAAKGRVAHRPICDFLQTPSEILAENGHLQGLETLLTGPADRS
jgi:myo-inositol-1(or 4)-monophosphatase